MSIKKYIPNSITSMNLLCGMLGVFSCFSGNVAVAFYFMLAAAVFDFCDGLSARMLGAYSDMGKELDSLSDVVSFGILPAVMLYCLANDSYEMAVDPAFNTPQLVKCLVFCSPAILAVFSGLRLAKFNVDSRQTDGFVGLATPASAILIGSFVCFLYNNRETDAFEALWNWEILKYYLPLLVLIVSALLVCEVRMFAFKIKKGHSLFSSYDGVWRATYLISVLAALVAVLWSGQHFSLAFLLFILLYIIINLLARIIACFKFK